MSTETATLHRHGFATGAALLEALSRPAAVDGADGIDTFLAVALYLRSCQSELAKSKALFGNRET
jgi:hypothetical protein